MAKGTLRNIKQSVITYNVCQVDSSACRQPVANHYVTKEIVIKGFTLYRFLDALVSFEVTVVRI